MGFIVMVLSFVVGIFCINMAKSHKLSKALGYIVLVLGIVLIGFGIFLAMPH